MSLRYIYHTLSQNKDPLMEKVTTFEEFLRLLDNPSVLSMYLEKKDLETSDEEAKGGSSSADKSIKQETSVKEKPCDSNIDLVSGDAEKDAESSKKVLAFRQYMYDQYVFEDSVDFSPPFSLPTLDLVQEIEKEFLDNEGKMSDERVEESDVEGKALPPLSELTYLERNSIKRGKMLDLLEPPLEMKQKEANKLKSRTSIMKQSILKHHTPNRIWKSDNEELNALYDHLYRVWKTIYDHPAAWPFHKPVTEEVAPQYYDIISHPIDLSTMQKGLRNLTYSSKREFFNDIYLMCENCRNYNTDLESPFRHKGNEIEDLARLLEPTVPDRIVVDKSGSEIIEKIEKQPEERVGSFKNGDAIIKEIIESEKAESQNRINPVVFESKDGPDVQVRVTRSKSKKDLTEQAKEDTSSSYLPNVNFIPPSEMWFMKNDNLRRSYISHRIQQRKIPFEDQDVLERSGDLMGSYMLEKDGFGLDVEDDSEIPKYKIVKKRSLEFIPEYVYRCGVIPDLPFPHPPPSKDTAQGALSSPIEAPSPSEEKERESKCFDLLDWRNTVSQQTKNMLLLQRLRLQKTEQSDALEGIYDVGETNLTPATATENGEPQKEETKDCPSLDIESGRRGIVALFAAHSGFTHITSEASDILCELLDDYLHTLGKSINSFMFINPEVESHVAALRVLGVMEERRSVPVMKTEWDDLMTGMDRMIERSMNHYFPTRKQNNTTITTNTEAAEETGQASTESDTKNSRLPDAQSNPTTSDQVKEDLKRKREEEEFTPNKMANLEES